MLKRQKLIKLSKEVLETRCPGFCTQARLTEDEYLREASHALASITSDVEDAAYANEAIILKRLHASHKAFLGCCLRCLSRRPCYQMRFVVRSLAHVVLH